MLTNDTIGIMLAITSALVWGGGDFTGGMSTRRHNQYVVLLLSALSGLVVLAAAALFWHESFPDWMGIFWSILAGFGGIVGISCLYKGLSIGRSAVVAPTSAVIGAALPVAFGLLTQGLPQLSRLIGFGLAFIGIWIVSQSSDGQGGESRKGLGLGFLAGLGFSGFFIFISKVGGNFVFTPLIIARIVVAIGAAVLLRANNPGILRSSFNWISLLAGMMDAGGNVFFLLAKQFTRLDMAVVISSLYPAGTVILAGLILKEKISLKQWIGVLICLAAIVLITIQ